MTPPRPRLSAWPFAALPAAGFLALVATVAAGSDRPPTKAAATPETPARVPFVGPFDVQGDPRFPPVNGKLAVDDDRQISFEVRYITGNAGSWREPLGDRLKLIKSFGQAAAWTLDDRALHELLTQAQRDTRTNVLMAPKVTSFNGARTTIVRKSKVHYVADVEALGGRPPGWRPVVKALDLGSRLDMTGTIEPTGTRLAVRLSDSWLTEMRTKSRIQMFDRDVQKAVYQVPTVRGRTCDFDCEIRESTHLLISEGPVVEYRKPTGLPGMANGLFAAIGLPEPIKPVPSERLVVITPRRIILESEEQPVRSASRAKGEPRTH